MASEVVKINIERLKEFVKEAKRLKEIMKKIEEGDEEITSFVMLVALLSIDSKLSLIDSKLSNVSSKLSYLMGVTAVIIGLLIAVAVKIFTI